MRRAGSWILFAVLALSLSVRCEAAGRAVAVVVDVTGEVTVHRQGEPQAVAAYVGMDLFEGDKLSAAGGGEVTAFYESGGTVKHDVAGGLVVGAGAPVANKPGVLSRLGSSLSDLFGSRTAVRADEAGAVEAGLVMARVAEEELADKKRETSQIRGAGAAERLQREKKSANSSLRPGGEPAPEEAPEGGQPAPRPPGDHDADTAPQDAESLPGPAGGPGAPPEPAPSPAVVQGDEPPDRLVHPQAPAAEAPRPPPPPVAPGSVRSRALGGLLDQKSGGGLGGGGAGDGGSGVRGPLRKGKPGPRQTEASERRWLPGLTLDVALARAKAGPVSGAVPALASAPLGGQAWLALPRGERVAANLAFEAGAAVTLHVKPASGAGWSLPLTLAPADEFDPVMANARVLSADGQMGELVAARMLEQKGFRLAAYLVQRSALMRLRAYGRSPVVLKRLAHQVAERALEMGDFDTVALLEADL